MFIPICNNNNNNILIHEDFLNCHGNDFIGLFSKNIIIIMIIIINIINMYLCINYFFLENFYLFGSKIVYREITKNFDFL